MRRPNFIQLKRRRKGVKKSITVPRKLTILELRSATCHMGQHSVTCTRYW